MEIPRGVLFDPPEIEYLDGHPYSKVSPKRTHALVQAALLRVLGDCAHGRGEVGPEWRFDLGAVDITYTEFVPDIAFVSYGRMDALNDEDAEEPPFAPDIAIEIRSPSNRAAYIARKMARYLKCGAILVLDVDPANRTIVAHSNGGARTFLEHDRFEHDAAPWFTFDIASIFPKPRGRR